jgi:hypothetical protein
MARFEYQTDLGNGKVQVHSRSDAGNPFSVVIWRDAVGTDVMYLAMAARAATVDKEAAAVATHQRRSVEP